MAATDNLGSQFDAPKWGEADPQGRDFHEIAGLWSAKADASNDWRDHDQAASWHRKVATSYNDAFPHKHQSALAADHHLTQANLRQSQIGEMVALGVRSAGVERDRAADLRADRYRSNMKILRNQ